MEPFPEATNISQASNGVTVSKVLPAVLSLHTHLKGWTARVKYCKPVLETLLSSLLRHFSGLFVRATPPQQRCTAISDSNYGSDIYVIAAALDPSFRLQWLDIDVAGSTTEKEDLRREVTGQLVYAYFVFIFLLFMRYVVPLLKFHISLYCVSLCVAAVCLISQ